jgi:sodium transport system ATP-binding protein
MQEVSALCDTAIVIGHGRVLAQGTLDVVRSQAGAENLEDAFVALLARAPEIS